MSMSLFRVDLEAATSHQRPQFWPQQSGFITFFLFSNGPDDALSRARAIAASLPFVLLDRPAHVHDLDGRRLSVVADENSVASDLREVLGEMEANARNTGLAFAFAPIGQAQPLVGSSKLIRMVIDPNAAHP